MNFRTLAACVAAVALAPSIALSDPPRETMLAFHNDLPSRYRLTHMRLFVDGHVRYDGPGFGAAYLPPGGHVVELVADYQMHGNVLSYMNHYNVEVRSAHVVRPRVAGAARVDAYALRHGGATTPLDRSAVIDWSDQR